MEGYDATTYGDRFADVYDDWYGDLTDADACVALVAELAAEGPVLELGVGTGRLAIPLAALGGAVVGVDSSASMLDRLSAKPGGDAVERLLGDMTQPDVGDRRFAVVFVAYNTLFNLIGPGEQQRCLASAAACLVPGGSVLVEAFVPEPGRVADAVSPRTITADRVVLSVSRSDPDRQEAMGQYVDITEAGIKLRPWHIRWSTPEQLDAMAADAGLVLADRWADWRRAPFHPDAQAHVTRYTLGP
ncbi:MAG: putative methyltransferase [Acidimicrobiales bacterium]|nr:putative methyltransferase [Acidimicrobiales bacterium]